MTVRRYVDTPNGVRLYEVLGGPSKNTYWTSNGDDGPGEYLYRVQVIALFGEDAIKTEVVVPQGIGAVVRTINGYTYTRVAPWSAEYTFPWYRADDRNSETDGAIQRFLEAGGTVLSEGVEL